MYNFPQLFLLEIQNSPDFPRKEANTFLNFPIEPKCIILITDFSLKSVFLSLEGGIDFTPNHPL